MSPAPIALSAPAGDVPLRVTLPPGRNRWLIGLGLGAALPWLLAFAVVSLIAPFVVPAELRRQAALGAVFVNLLALPMHMLAVAGVWLAAYALRGTETLTVGEPGPAGSRLVVVRRRALRLTVPIRLRLAEGASLRPLDTSLTPGRGPHPRFEVRSGGAAIRFGAGLADDEAVRLAEVLAEAVREVSEGLPSAAYRVDHPRDLR